MFCFADAAHAALFLRRFGGEYIIQKIEKGKER